MKTKSGLYYSNEHEWIEVKDGVAYVGITDYAQDSLGDIAYVELPEVGDELNAGDNACVVESVKAASDVYSPVSGKIVEVNEELDASPEKINEDAYSAWIFKVELANEEELSSLMDENAYKSFCKEA
ncbi:MAG: glycine cleavage system protein GcvH [Clostridiales bacterium]|nr:glycine cleavage system protein GcvH [Clostridiales bacterium]